ncbi:integral membrane protein [Aspergillus terreus]|uniref:Integral membrane protein n=1 Tax=Aspergillus terreus TaxID=33178 RepID=A0A5M3ZAZ9_ASPTE|nr:hypothetical protein ATETN484_0011011300 [Aspergillus terreus]GFF18750.1 integral membrane protein [Aspergillus terreus]
MSGLTARGTNEQLVQEEPNHWSRTLIAIAIMTMTLATIAFVLRLYSRQKTNWKLAIEDLFMGLGLLCSYGLNVSAFNGVGHNVWALPEQTQGRAALLFWLGQKFWALAHTFVKLSIVLLIRRLLHTVGPWQAVTTSLIVFTVAWGITAVIGNAFQCLPARYFWERDIEGHCSVHQEAFSISIGSLALLEDAVLLLIPVLIVWRLTLECAEKIRITLLFSVGGLVCVFSILRVIELIHYQTDNLTGMLKTAIAFRDAS